MFEKDIYDKVTRYVNFEIEILLSHKNILIASKLLRMHEFILYFDTFSIKKDKASRVKFFYAGKLQEILKIQSTPPLKKGPFFENFFRHILIVFFVSNHFLGQFGAPENFFLDPRP